MKKFDVSKNYYKILGVKENATIDEIKTARNNMARVFHPDSIDNKYISEDMKATFEKNLKDVNEAFRILSDKELRKEYDQYRVDYGYVHRTNFQVTKYKGDVSKVVSEEPIDENIVRKFKRYNVKTIILLVTVALLGSGLLYTSCSAKKNRKPEITAEEEAKQKALETLVPVDDSTEIEPVVTDIDNGFTDPFDETQVSERADEIIDFLNKSDVNNISKDDIITQLKFINGSYTAESEVDAYDTMNKVLETFAAYGTAVSQEANAAGGVVDEFGVSNAPGLELFLTDNIEHKDLVNQWSTLYSKVLTGSTIAEKVEASKEFIQLQSDLMLGELEDSTGTKLIYSSLENNEIFILGIMAQVDQPIVVSALGDDYKVTYLDNAGNSVANPIQEVGHHYNPYCNEEYDEDNVWNLSVRELVYTSLLDKSVTNEDEKSLTLN